MKINLFMIRNLLLVMLVGFCMNSFADRPKDDDQWKLVQKLLDERIRQNTLLIEQGRQDEANYVIDMHKLLLGESKRFIPATMESSLQRELGDVFLGGNKTDLTGRIQPYLIILLPAFEAAEYLERGDELRPLKVDSASYTLGLRNTHQRSLIATLVITGYITSTANPQGVYVPIAGSTYALNQKLGFDMFNRFASVPARPRQQTTEAFIGEVTERFITILEGPATPPASAFEVTCDVTMEQLTRQTQTIREREYESALTGFKDLLGDVSKKVNGCDYLFTDQDLAFVKDDVFSGQVIPDKLVTLAQHSNFKLYVVFKEVNFAMSSTDWVTFAQRVYEGSSLAGSNSILMIVPYLMLDIGCSHTNRWLGKRVNDRTAVTTPVIYSADATVKNAMNLALGTATDWNTGFLDAFKKIPKDHIIYSYYFRVDGKALQVTSTDHNQTDNESIVELNFWYDREAMEYLAHTTYNPHNASDYASSNPLLASRSVSTWENFNREIETRLKNPNPQMHPHNLKEQYIETYHQAYAHNYLKRTYPRYFSEGISAPEPLPDDALIEAPQDLVLVAIDAASLILSPWGLDAVAEVVGVMYCTYKGDYVSAALYASSLALVAVTPAIIKGFIRGADVAITAERKVAVELIEGAAQTAARSMLDGYDAAAKLLILSPNDIDNVVDAMPPLSVNPVEIKTIRINGVDYDITTTGRFFMDGNVMKCYIDGGYCFAAGTPVLLADGSRANIEHITKGQKILSYDHHAGVSCENKVVSVVRRTASRISRLLLAGAALFVTPEHPLFANNEYTQAQHLHPGDSILTAEGNYKKVESIVTYDSAVTVYNLEVENAHNYFAGERALLVHNSCGWLTIKNAVEESSFRIFHNKVINAALTAPERKVFYEFLASMPDQTLFNRIVSHEISPGAWAALHRAERHALKADPEILAKVTKVLEHGNLARYIPIETGTRNITTRIGLLEQIAKLQDEAGTLSKARMSPLGDLMDNLDHFLVTHASKPGSVDFMKELTESARKMVGGSFILHVLKNNPDKIGTVIRFETTVATQVDDIGDVVVDIVSTKGTVSNIFNEFKNWGGMSPNYHASFVRQFAAYLISKDVGGFYYFFKKDAQGINALSDLRSSVATAMKNNKSILDDLPPEKLRLFGEIENQALKDSNIDHFLNNNFAKIFDLVE